MQNRRCEKIASTSTLHKVPSSLLSERVEERVRVEQIGQIELIVEQTTAVRFLHPRLNGDSTSDQAAQEEKRILGTVPVVEPLLRTLHAEQYRSIKDHYICLTSSTHLLRHQSRGKFQNLLRQQGRSSNHFAQ